MAQGYWGKEHMASQGAATETHYRLYEQLPPGCIGRLFNAMGWQDLAPIDSRQTPVTLRVREYKDGSVTIQPFVTDSILNVVEDANGTRTTDLGRLVHAVPDLETVRDADTTQVSPSHRTALTARLNQLYHSWAEQLNQRSF